MTLHHTGSAGSPTLCVVWRVCVERETLSNNTEYQERLTEGMDTRELVKKNYYKTSDSYSNRFVWSDRYTTLNTTVHTLPHTQETQSLTGGSERWRTHTLNDVLHHCTSAGTQ